MTREYFRVYEDSNNSKWEGDKRWKVRKSNEEEEDQEKQVDKYTENSRLKIKK